MLIDTHGYAFVINDSDTALPTEDRLSDEELLDRQDLERRQHLTGPHPVTRALPLSLAEKKRLEQYVQRRLDSAAPRIEGQEFEFRRGTIYRLRPKHALALVSRNPARLRLLREEDGVPSNYLERRILTAAEIRANELACIPDPETAWRDPSTFVVSVQDDVVRLGNIMTDAEFRAAAMRRMK